MKWGKVEDIGREAHLCEETAYGELLLYRNSVNVHDYI